MIFIHRTLGNVRTFQTLPPIDTLMGEPKNWECRNDWKSFSAAKRAARRATCAEYEEFIAIDKGPHHHPQFDVIQAPAVGDDVSYAFNGDYYPDGQITRISLMRRVITTSTGNRYYRARKNSGTWLKDKTWSLVPGHIDARNPHF